MLTRLQQLLRRQTFLPVLLLAVLAGLLLWQIPSVRNSVVWTDHTILILICGVGAISATFYAVLLKRSRAMVRDLTQQQSAGEQALHESEFRYRTLFESIDEGFCIFQMVFDNFDRPIDYRFIEVNPSFEKQTGIKDAKGKRIREIAPDFEQNWIDIYARIATDGQPCRFQNKSERLGRWFDVYAFRVGRPEERCVATLFNDITQQKLSDETLRESEERFRAIYERAPLGMEQVALDGRILMVNHAQCELLGYSEDEMLKLTFLDFTHPDDHAKELALLERLLTGKQQSYSLEKRYLKKNGDIVWVSITSTLVHSKLNAPDYRITVVEDITLKKHAERALIRAEKLAVTGRMASAMAHEINNPLGAALNSVYLASLDERLGVAVKSYLDLAQRELERVAHITRQTLGFYRETGSPTVVDLRQVADEVVNLYRPKLENKSIRVEREYLTGTPVCVMEGEVRQILSNLISNSIDAVPQSGCIRLRIAGPTQFNGDRPAVRFSISDNGSGIKPQHMKQIFEPFFSTKKATGTGLGLWVTKQLIKKQDGKIRTRSKPGIGTVFQIFLPLERRSPERVIKEREKEERDILASA